MKEQRVVNLQWFAEDPAPETPPEPQGGSVDHDAPDSKPKDQEDREKPDELETLRRENARLKAEAARVALRDTAAGLLKEHKMEPTPDVLDLVLGEDEEATKANIDKLDQYIKARLQAAEKARATGRTPQHYGGRSDGQKTAFQQKLDKYKPKKG